MNSFDMKKLFFLLIFGFMATTLFAQKASKIATVAIQTSANCGECKSRIEGGLQSVKGVKSSSLDLDTKVLTVNYRTKKTNVEAIRTAISMIGYDADEVVANQEAHDNLPKCCRKGGHD